MPAEKNKVARILVPLIVLGVTIAAVVAVFRSSRPSTVPTATAPASQQSPTATAPESASAAKPGETTSHPAASTETTDGSKASTGAGQPKADEAAPAPSAAPATGYGAIAVPPTDGNAPLAALGSIDPDSGYHMRLTFSAQGAGVETITLSEQYKTLRDKLEPNHAGERFQVQEQISYLTDPLDPKSELNVSSLAARAVLIDDVPVDLYGGAGKNFWKQIAPGQFEATIAEGASGEGKPIARITRTYQLDKDTYEIKIRQRLENISGRELRIQWIQYGPVDVEEEAQGIKLAARRVRYGYMLDPAHDPSRTYVEADNKLEARETVIKAADDAYAASANALGTRDLSKRNELLFPRGTYFGPATDLVWTAQTSRYFTFAVMPLIEAAQTTPPTPLVAKPLALAKELYGVPLGPVGGQEHLVLQMIGAESKVAPGGSQDLSFAAYAGPLARDPLAAGENPLYRAIGLDHLVVYNLGGCCAWCTFQWLATSLLWFLRFIHGILGDWTLAIMLLVLVVRTILHPVTRRSQIGMARFGKQMQALAPKQKKLKEQFKDDPKRLQQEMARLMQEEGVSYTGALGCLPMFLQSPVWFALYAMLYFAFELRHTPGFYGVFQSISGGHWLFLADLSAPDHFIPLGTTITIPFLGAMMGPISAINLLPIILGVVFFIQQKYLTPPSTTALTPEQEAQQKMTKWMMVFMFPIMMYNSPSGLTVYFITNSTLGILESRYIRSHINQLDMTPRPRPKDGRKRVANEARMGNPFAKDRELKRFKDR